MQKLERTKLHLIFEEHKAILSKPLESKPL
jgi:hypothetical protein